MGGGGWADDRVVVRGEGSRRVPVCAGAGPDGAGDGLVVNVIPSMGFIKGTVGDDYVVPCLDMVIEVTTTTGSGAHRSGRGADCQRMIWSEATVG